MKSKIEVKIKTKTKDAKETERIVSHLNGYLGMWKTAMKIFYKNADIDFEITGKDNV